MVAASNIGLNSFLVNALWKCDKLKILSYLLIMCLCISDIFVGISGLLRESLLIKTQGLYSGNMKEVLLIIMSIESFWVNFSALFVLIIAIDRYIHMKHGLRYRLVMTKRRAIGLVTFNFVFTSHMIVTVKLLPKYQKGFLLKHLQAYRIYRVVLSLTYLSFILSIFTLYVKTYFSIKQTVEPAAEVATNETAEINLANESTNRTLALKLHQNRRRRPEQEFAKVMGIVLITLLVCLTPNLCISFYRRVVMLSTAKYNPSNGLRMATRLTFLMMRLNSSINAAIIIVFSRELRRYTKHFFCYLCNGEWSWILIHSRRLHSIQSS